VRLAFGSQHAHREPHRRLEHDVELDGFIGEDLDRVQGCPLAAGARLDPVAAGTQAFEAIRALRRMEAPCFTLAVRHLQRKAQVVEGMHPGGFGGSAFRRPDEAVNRATRGRLSGGEDVDVQVARLLARTHRALCSAPLSSVARSRRGEPDITTLLGHRR
jgi:hypothetical protein